MSSKNLEAMIAKEEKALEGYKNKIAEYERKAKDSEAKLEEYRMMQNSQKFSEMADIIKQSGLSMDDLIVAIQSGNLLDLQEKMEESQKASEAMLEDDENNFGE